MTLALRQIPSGFAVVHIFKGAFVSHKLLPSILLACALFAFPAFAQTGATTKIAAPATNKADVLTPDQAKRALDTLQDDNKRAQMIDTLRAIANASPQAQAAPPAPGPQPAIPLTADSLGAQLLLTVSEQVGEISHEIAVKRAIILLRFDWLIGLIGALLGDLKWRTRASGSCPAGA